MPDVGGSTSPALAPNHLCQTAARTSGVGSCGSAAGKSVGNLRAQLNSLHPLMRLDAALCHDVPLGRKHLRLTIHRRDPGGSVSSIGLPVGGCSQLGFP